MCTHLYSCDLEELPASILMILHHSKQQVIRVYLEKFICSHEGNDMTA